MACFQFEQLTVVIVGKNHNPTILNPDFLSRNGIVPGDWDTSQNPVCTDLVAQVAFKSGIIITAEMSKVTFVDKARERLPDSSLVPEIAKRYMDVLPHVAYTALGVNPQGKLRFQEEEGARSLMMDSLIDCTRWRGITDKPITGILSLTLPLDEFQLNVGIREAALEEGEEGSAVIINANFHYQPELEEVAECNKALRATIDKWPWCVEFFQDRVVATLQEES